MSHRLAVRRRDCRFERMEPRLLLAADVVVPPGELQLPDGELFLPGSVAGQVFAASAPSGVRSPIDQGIAGVQVELLDAAGNVLARTLTDAAGAFDFPALTPGTYAIREIQPNGFVDGADWIGAGGGLLAANDLISQIVVTPGDALLGYDFAEHAATDGAAQPSPDQAALHSPLPLAPLAQLTPPPLNVEWPRPAVAPAPQPAVEIVAAESSSLPALVQRRPERIFGSSGRIVDQEKLELDAAFSDEEEDGNSLTMSPDDGRSAEATADDESLAATDGRNLARERAFELEVDATAEADRSGVVEAAAVVPAAPVRRGDSTHQIAGKPAA